MKAYLMTLFVSLLRPIRLALLLVLGGAVFPCYSADITVGESGSALRLRGEIAAGDFTKIVALLRAKPTARVLVLDSPGGDAGEAMRIGRLLRQLRMKTVAPTSLGSTVRCPVFAASMLDPIRVETGCNCYSACFLVFVGGIERVGDHLGIHRAFLNPDLQRRLQAGVAAEVSASATRKIEAYLAEMRVPQSLVERMRSIPSGELELVSKEETRRHFSGFIPEFEEWIRARCPDRSDDLAGRLADLMLLSERRPLTAVEKAEFERLDRRLAEATECEDRAKTEIALESFALIRRYVANP